MGILNITDDSFYDGGRYADHKTRVDHCKKMMGEGADIIDLGAMSTRPGAAEISAEEEKDRLLPVIDLLLENVPGIRISVDTYRVDVARAAAERGAVLINDISGGTFDPEMAAFIGESQMAYVMMHIQGKPRNMQNNPSYDDVVTDLMRFFGKQLELFYSKGAGDIILDPGFGFGKSLEHNYTILRNLRAFCTLGLPLLVGVSRKSMINKVLGTNPETALNGTTAAHMIALIEGASILRVHDVKAAKEAISIFEAYKGAEQPNG